MERQHPDGGFTESRRRFLRTSTGMVLSSSSIPYMGGWGCSKNEQALAPGHIQVADKVNALRGMGARTLALLFPMFAADRGQLSPQGALKKLGVKWNRITESLGRDEQIRQWLYLKNAYPARLRSLLS